MGTGNYSGGSEGLTTSASIFKRASRFEAGGDRRFKFRHSIDRRSCDPDVHALGEILK
jgi:hypothetical protein